MQLFQVPEMAALLLAQLPLVAQLPELMMTMLLAELPESIMTMLQGGVPLQCLDTGLGHKYNTNYARSELRTKTYCMSVRNADTDPFACLLLRFRSLFLSCSPRRLMSE